MPDVKLVGMSLHKASEIRIGKHLVKQDMVIDERGFIMMLDIQTRRSKNWASDLQHQRL